MSAKDKPAASGGSHGGGNRPAEPNPTKPAGGVDEASHGGGKRNAESLTLFA